ncbi:MAG: M23 family metallopeptidase [Syntrophomonadaceae bacterium]|jgi:LysM repeat protein|nr:M23 family metallopeptidase [Syntrophomonadaceae bacterium]
MFKKTLCMLITLTVLVSLMPGEAMGWLTEDDFVPCSTTGGMVTDNRVKLHRVARGENLWQIARDHCIDVETLMVMNNLSGECTILEGQLLEVPFQRSRVHRVREGETVWRIARMYQADVSDILKANNIRSPERLRVGQALNIPADSDSKSQVVLMEPPSRGLFTPGFSWPLLGAITSAYGWRKSGYHHGVDIAARQGTQIRAAGSGKVTFAGYKPIYGRTVILEHPDGKKTLYAHAAALKVKMGEQVKRGQTIATVGSSGRSTGPHLHFEVYVNGKTTNPINYLNR